MASHNEHFYECKIDGWHKVSLVSYFPSQVFPPRHVITLLMFLHPATPWCPAVTGVPAIPHHLSLTAHLHTCFHFHLPSLYSAVLYMFPLPLIPCKITYCALFLHSFPCLLWPPASLLGLFGQCRIRLPHLPRRPVFDLKWTWTLYFSGLVSEECFWLQTCFSWAFRNNKTKPKIIDFAFSRFLAFFCFTK